MTCHAKDIAQRVVQYQELSDEERAEIDAHVTQCEECARTFWALDRFMAKLWKIGEQRRMSLVHPTEEEIIQMAVDPSLLEPAKRTRLLVHLRHGQCAPCERVYWSIVESEHECKRQEKEESRVHVWEQIAPAWRKPAFALALLLLIVQAVEIRQMLSMKQQIRQQTQLSARPSVSPGPDIAFKVAEERAQAMEARAAEARKENQAQHATIAGLRKQLQPFLKPRADSASVLLLAATRGGDAPPRLQLEPSKLFVVLQANLSKELGTYKTYKLVLRDSNETVVKSDKTRQREETFNYLVRRELLKSGSYKLQIYGLDGGQEHYLAEFPFQVASAK